MGNSSKIITPKKQKKIKKVDHLKTFEHHVFYFVAKHQPRRIDSHDDSEGDFLSTPNLTATRIDASARTLFDNKSLVKKSIHNVIQ